MKGPSMGIHAAYFVEEDEELLPTIERDVSKSTVLHMSIVRAKRTARICLWLQRITQMYSQTNGYYIIQERRIWEARVCRL